MLLHLREILTREELHEARAILASAPWEDGRFTAGEQSARAKVNQQLREDTEATRGVQQLVLRGLQRHAIFYSAVLPKQISPPLVNRYGGEANRFGSHVDSAVRFSDISCTLFLSEPDEYDGGELVVEDTFGNHRVKLPAGDMVVYPGTSVHGVLPVTRGYRVASFFWIQSMIRSDEHRRLLFEMDNHLRALRSKYGETEPAIIGLTSTYHNLLRAWLDV